MNRLLVVLLALSGAGVGACGGQHEHRVVSSEAVSTTTVSGPGIRSTPTPTNELTTTPAATETTSTTADRRALVLGQGLIAYRLVVNVTDPIAAAHTDACDPAFKRLEDVTPGSLTHCASWWDDAEQSAGTLCAGDVAASDDYRRILAIKQSFCPGAVTENERQRALADGASPAAFGDGLHAVGSEIEPGEYETTAVGDCYWAIHNTPNTGTGSVVKNDLGSGTFRVTLQVGTWFESRACGVWLKQP